MDRYEEDEVVSYYTDDKYWDDRRPPSEYQHERVVVLRKLISCGIPSILWGEDAEEFAFNCNVSAARLDQHILVPDDRLYTAVACIREHFPQYYPTTDFNPDYAEIDWRPLAGINPLPCAVRLKHSSYYGLDVRESDQFQPLDLEPPFDALNAGILVPKYGTFIEGLVEIYMSPPTGSDPAHGQGATKHRTMLDELFDCRIQGPDHDYEPDPNGWRGKEPDVLLPIEKEIIGELRTEKEIWFMTHLAEEYEVCF
ncbi:hypothetical protein EUX98_g6455 [Antrodiella citrinella]|uniref:Uncharacterized protein n=1 Tax=Antrodiella citrinella TaxID=2447956 RepID=A0A4S4MWG1_9APHY|nr:hypothetical protein EUX98_g6455 [Antrodiella citrinella]